MKDLNILIVEDEIIIYMHITRTLKNLGIKNIYTARTSEEALLIAFENKIDILFSDIKIEGDIDGIDTASQLQSLYGLPVIFITAYKDKEMLERVSKLDIIGYLLKPFRVDELETLIELAISKYKLGSQNQLLVLDEIYTYCKKEKILYANDTELNLTKKERIFLILLLENINSYVSYELIESLVWYDEMVADSTRRTFYSRAKQKLKNINFQTQRALGVGIFINKS